jgi:hypothetical protein cfetvA_11649
MSKISEFKQAQRKQIDELIAEMFIEEDAETVLSREKRELQGYDLTPVVKILSIEIHRLRRSSQER